ncbi:MAG TPA: Ig-like domain-containing protein [Leptolyngbyaceae cyanobacterium M33_DOE_097]|uniref:Uncharacterized protein n=1 Tax=Oscillatoriales cyanobacterium SpSt-418 TaxID=2282169 RepID=A0A7C3PEZ9_9CYAN|nr:Ig-like domain-containing protein [Leptolyngbyaceae cyanobacterium M33_DOE_097]
MRSPASSNFPQPLDRVAVIWMVALSLCIGLLLVVGAQTAPRVRNFSWQTHQVGAEDTAFILTFNRPMDTASIEQNLKITPPLPTPGKVSWAGRRMAYTLSAPAPYGKEFQVTVEGGRDRFGGDGSVMQPFVGQFRTRDRAFAYIGVKGEEAGRLILFNFKDQQKQILTPSNLTVMDFQPYPLSDRILFAAVERRPEPVGLTEQKLYSVSTGIQIEPPPSVRGAPALPPAKQEPAGKLELVLDNTDYQNLKFDLAPNGQIVVVQRASRKNPSDFGPWVIREGKAAEPLGGDPGGDFLITPDSDALAIAQGQGLAIVPLEPDAKPLDFLPKFGVVLNFKRDGSQAAMVKFNTDRTRSLFLVTNQGTEKELLRTQGSINKAVFDPTGQYLYCLLTELKIQGELYQEDPYLAVVDLKTGKETPLVKMPNQADVQMSLSPDGLGILFDQTVSQQTVGSGAANTTSDGRSVTDSRLWFLPVNPKQPTAKPELESLPLPGLQPRWMP